jgi:hypothetical protein
VSKAFHPTYTLFLCLLVIISSGCESPDAAFRPAPARFFLPQGTRVTIIPEQGDDAAELCHKLYELFASRGHYTLIDRANLGQTFEERRFQKFDVVEERPIGQIGGVDAFLYLQAEYAAESTQATDPLSILLAPHSTDTLAHYVAIYRMVLVRDGHIVAARQLRLTDKESPFFLAGHPQPLIQKLREQAAWQIFDSLHP